MKSFIRFLVLALSFTFVINSSLQAATLNLEIKGNSCAVCASKIETTLKKIDGVSKCTVDTKTNKVTVEYDAAKVSPEKITEVCNGTGFSCN